MTAKEIITSAEQNGFEQGYNMDLYYHTEEDIEQMLKEYTKVKCQELLEIVAEKAKTKTIYESNDQPSSSFRDYEYNVVDKDSILNAVDLNSFIS